MLERPDISAFLSIMYHLDDEILKMSLEAVVLGLLNDRLRRNVTELTVEGEITPPNFC